MHHWLNAQIETDKYKGLENLWILVSVDTENKTPADTRGQSSFFLPLLFLFS